MIRTVCLSFAIDMEVKCKSSEVEGERVLGRVVDRWMSASEGVLDLLDGGQDLGSVKVHSAVSQTNQFHVENLNRLQALRRWIEDQSKAILGNVDDDVDENLKRKQRILYFKIVLHIWTYLFRVENLDILDRPHLRLDDGHSLRKMHS